MILAWTSRVLPSITFVFWCYKLQPCISEDLSLSTAELHFNRILKAEAFKAKWRPDEAGWHFKARKNLYLPMFAVWNFTGVLQDSMNSTRRLKAVQGQKNYKIMWGPHEIHWNRPGLVSFVFGLHYLALKTAKLSILARDSDWGSSLKNWICTSNSWSKWAILAL